METARNEMIDALRNKKAIKINNTILEFAKDTVTTYVGFDKVACDKWNEMLTGKITQIYCHMMR